MANPRGNPETLVPFKSGDSYKGPKNKRITLRIRTEQEQHLKAIPNWTDKLRDAIDRLIQEHETGGGQGDG